MSNSRDLVSFIKSLYPGKDFIPLHEPVFLGNEKNYLNECVDSTFVSSVGKYVDLFESKIVDFTGAKYAVAVVNGTNALQVALRLVGVDTNTEVITQALTFVATCNAIKYLGADPVFVDVDRDTMGLSPESLGDFLRNHTEIIDGVLYNKHTRKRIAACMPMHTFGHPARIADIAEICREWKVPLIEDAAESLGSFSDSVHTGLSGQMGVLSFNGNKTITTGGGGMIICNDETFAKKAKYLTTTAKVPHAYEFNHDELGYNFRMPNINAALGCAQMEKLEFILENKRETANLYKDHMEQNPDLQFINEPAGSRSNYWLNAVLLKNLDARNRFIQETNSNGVMTRPIWTLMTKLPMFKDSFSMELPNSWWLEDRVVNLPSGVRVQ